MTIDEKDLKDVMLDLAALVDAGEASEASRGLVAAYRRVHPGFMPVELGTQPPAASGTDGALETLRKTRQLIRLRTIFNAMAIAFTLLPFSFRGGDDGVSFLFLGREPGVVAASLSVAAASWVAMIVMTRALRTRGL